MAGACSGIVTEENERTVDGEASKCCEKIVPRRTLGHSLVRCKQVSNMSQRGRHRKTPALPLLRALTTWVQKSENLKGRVEVAKGSCGAPFQ